MGAPANTETGKLMNAGKGGLFAALIAVVLCETPFLAALLIGVGAGSQVGQVSGWLDTAAVVLVLASIAFITMALLKRRRSS